MSPMQKHEAYLLNELLPGVTRHADEIGCTPMEAGLAAYLALFTVLIDSGMPVDLLEAATKEISTLNTHEAPKGVQ